MYIRYLPPISGYYVIIRVKVPTKKYLSVRSCLFVAKTHWDCKVNNITYSTSLVERAVGGFGYRDMLRSTRTRTRIIAK